ncbi:histidine phosphatase family protein [candidate division WWE3 bacterium]|uniref:Histidine phosphatase family protein n=1 Tax=candidate division WWE3 bacterium TaxID=2053526 RepID=A0A955LHT4_UNCKA|nr:histidine phosphatase family protein [candidate division WWE3 bacterium]
MKWPSSLVFIRHGQSQYNKLKVTKEQQPEYQEFKQQFKREFESANEPDWVSSELRDLAIKAMKAIKLKNINDQNTPLTDEGYDQAVQTGARLKDEITLPDTIFISPYLRTRQTFEGIAQSWPGLNDVPHVFEDRIREQEHGLASVFNDRAIYLTLNPLQALLFKQEGKYYYRYLNGESRSDVKSRLRSMLGTFIREYAEKNILLVSHHLTLLCLRSNLERWDVETFLSVDEKEKPINCGVTVYKGNSKLGANGRLELESYNQQYY